LNGERLVIPVLFGAYDIDIGVNTGFRHGSAIRTRDLEEVYRIGLIVVATSGVEDDGVARKVRKRGRGG
jgi:hypothetical protein